MKEKLAKAEAFYFQHFLSAAVSHELFKECASQSQTRRLGGLRGWNEPPFYQERSASCEKGPLLWSTMNMINLCLRRTL